MPSTLDFFLLDPGLLGGASSEPGALPWLRERMRALAIAGEAGPAGEPVRYLTVSGDLACPRARAAATRYVAHIESITPPILGLGSLREAPLWSHITSCLCWREDWPPSERSQALGGLVIGLVEQSVLIAAGHLLRRLGDGDDLCDLARYGRPPGLDDRYDPAFFLRYVRAWLPVILQASAEDADLAVLPR